MSTRAGRKRRQTVTLAGRKPIDGTTPGPTPERLRHSQGHYEVGDDQQGAQVYTILDNPLARALARETINERQYRALTKFKHHHSSAGLEPSYGSADMDRVFSSDVGAFSGMAKTENQVFHRQRYRQAVQIMGMNTSRVVEAVVCAEWTLEDAGTKILAWSHALQARAAVVTILREAGDRLASEWGVDG